MQIAGWLSEPCKIGSGKGSRYVGGQVSKKNKKDISWAMEERRGL